MDFAGAGVGFGTEREKSDSAALSSKSSFTIRDALAKKVVSLPCPFMTARSDISMK